MADVPPWDVLASDREDLLAKAVESFSRPYDPETDSVNPFMMLLVNVIDPVMGDSIRTFVQQGLAAPLAAVHCLRATGRWLCSCPCDAGRGRRARGRWRRERGRELRDCAFSLRM